MKVKKKFSELEEGDLKIENGDYCYIDFGIFPDISGLKGKDVKTTGCRMFPAGSYGKGVMYSRSYWDNDSEIEVITADEAKDIREAYKELLYKTWELKELIFKQDAIPILYTSDTTLNYPLKEGDVLLRRSFRYNDEVEILVIEDTEYHKALDDIPQEEQFYEWSSETYKDYRVSIPGRKIIVNNMWSQYHNEPYGTIFNIGAYRTNCFLLRDVKNPVITANKIRDHHTPLYGLLKTLYEKYYGKLKEEPKVVNWTYDPDARK